MVKRVKNKNTNRLKSNQKITIDLTAKEIERVLGCGVFEGITQNKAKELVRAYGKNAVEAIECSEEEAQKILGDQWKKAYDEIEEHQAAIPMVLWLLQQGFSGVLAKKTMIWQMYESDFLRPNDALNAWKKDPYLLCEIPGVSFERADKIAMELLHLNGDDPLRLIACTKEALKVGCDQAGGGTSLKETEFLVKKLLKGPGPGVLTNEEVLNLTMPALSLAEKEGWLKQTKDELGNPMIFSRDLYDAEEAASHLLLKMLKEPSSLNAENLEERLAVVEKSAQLILSEEQRAAIKVMFKGRICVVYGKPGSGKTTLLKCVAPLLEEGGKKVFYAAPTGKAAKKMSQCLNREASTIHRLMSLGANNLDGMDDDENEEQVKNADAIVIDETSMLDSRMFLRVLRRLGKETSLILLGDPNQLPSVGAGKVLQDLIDSKAIPMAFMSQVRRQSATSSINIVANTIGEGRWIDFKDKQKDCILLEEPNAEFLAIRINNMLMKAKKSNYDALKDCQILCAGNQGPAGVNELNLKFQNLLNPRDGIKNELQVKESLLLREGDKVMQSTNDYERVVMKEVNGERTFKKGVYNGDVGYIEKIKVHEGKITVRFDNGLAEYEAKEAAGSLSLSYACTVHKFQGSEAPVIFYIMHASTPLPLRNRNLIYTAITRAKMKCIVMGSEYVLKESVKKNALSGRRTRLKGLIEGSLSVDPSASEWVKALSDEKVIHFSLGERSPAEDNEVILDSKIKRL